MRDDRVRTNLHLVLPIARKIKKKLPQCFDLTDLIGEGNLGLVRAAESYLPTQKLPFYTYARRKIRSAIYDSVRRRKWRDATGNWRDSGDPRVQVQNVEMIRKQLEPAAMPSTDALAIESENRRDLDEAMGKLKPREAQVVSIHYYADETLKSAGAQMNMHETQAVRLHRQALRKMHRHFKLQGRTAA